MDKWSSLVREINLLKGSVSNLQNQAKVLRQLSTRLPLVDYGADSTVTGWSSYTSWINYCKTPFNVGELIFCWFYIFGTSNATTATFTLPFENRITTGLDRIRVPGIGMNNGSWLNDPILIELPSASNTVATGINLGTVGGFTNSGSKRIRGEFFYWCDGNRP